MSPARLPRQGSGDRPGTLDALGSLADVRLVEWPDALVGYPCPADLKTPGPAARAWAEHLAAVFGGTARGILHYGSRAQGRASSPDSPFDFFVVVDSYTQALHALAAHQGRARPAALGPLLVRILPPSAVSVRRPGGAGECEAKCVLISTKHLRRECSRRARDHFVRGRLCQHVVLAWSRDPQSARDLLGCVRAVREGAFDWLRPFLPTQFDVGCYCRRLLDVSLAHEIRPEAAKHAEVLYTAQRELLIGTFAEALQRLQERGILLRHGQAFTLRHPVGRLERLRIRGFFGLSKLRTTLRLLKHPFLYDGWLDYLIRKLERHSEEKIELSPRERRWPLIFLWPRAVRYLRTRPQRQG